MADIFDSLNNIISEQARLIKDLREKLEELEVGKGGGGGSASIEDYVVGKTYKRNILIVDPATETVYRAIDEFVSESIKEDHEQGHIKLVGYESQVITFDHLPTQAEIDTLPEDSLVTIYSTTDDPYIPIINSD